MSNPKLYKQTFLSNSSWTAPAGVKYITVTGCGGGGGGGGEGRDFNDTGNGSAGGNGGSGFIEILWIQ